MRGRTVRTQKNREKLLAALSAGLSVARAAAEAGIGRRTAYEWREADAALAAEWEDAIECGTDILEDEAKRRACDGIEKPVHYQGQRVDTVTEYSDTLLIFMLKARRPEKYRERRDVSVKGDVSVTKHEVRPVSDYKLIRERVAQLRLVNSDAP